MTVAPRPPRGVLDAGLQPERTVLAWRRTVLALTLGGVLSLRVLPPVLGAWGVALGVGGTLAGLVLAVLASRRQRAVAVALGADRPPPGAGALLAAVATLAAGGAALALVATLSLAAGTE
ncbi:DUF202 domain-containing protein [Cellulomonas endophytica]|uniref:DUF202 domain-containing protein n=1 Tax=Cellulomonas endophytica TaxID=2494735 RepID=UPI001F0C91FF|nr:DUF202 domain-containing protein [Cellulomonas endophytica]